MSRFTQLESVIKNHVSALHREKMTGSLIKNNIQATKVTIITTSFNQGRFLERTILSVLNQEWPNLEYIVVDGGSTDDSVKIIKRYSNYISWWISESDEGQTHAINKGIKNSSGEYITWLGSDDILLPGALTTMASALDQNPDAGIVYGGTAFIDHEDRVLKTHAYRDLTLKSLLYKRHSTIAQPSSMLRRKTLKTASGLDESLVYCMDYDLWIRLLKISCAINLGEVILSGYRLHSKSKTISAYRNMALEKIRVNRRYTKDIINKVIYAHYWYIIEAYVKSIVRRGKIE